MGYAAGQTTGQTGVGSTANTTGQTQQAGYGGKGGGQATQPQPTELAQPSQSSSVNTSTPQPVFGGNALGYNISRLSQRMDPSATLPQAQQASSSSVQTPAQAAPTGGKGGGYGELAQLPEVQNFLGQMMQQPQQQQPQQQPQQQQPYGVSGAQAFDPNAYYGQQQPQAYAPVAQTFENPFASQMQQYQQQMQDMQSDYQRQLDALKEQTKGLEDTGEIIRPLPGDADYIYSQTEEEAQAQAEEAKNLEERNKQLAQVYRIGATGADINKYFGDVLNIDAGAVVDKNGNIVVYNPKNAKEYIRIPKNSYVDEKGNIIKPDGSKVNIPTSYLAETSDKAKYSQGIQYGDTIQDVKDYFSDATDFAVSDKAKINTAGTVILEGGTQIPAGSYVDTDGKLRYPSGKLIPINAKDKPTYKDDTALAALDKFTPKGGYKDYVPPTIKVAADYDPYIKAQKAEMDIAKKALDAAMKSGSEKAIQEAQTRYEDQKADYDAVVADKAARSKSTFTAATTKEKERIKKRADESKAKISAAEKKRAEIAAAAPAKKEAAAKKKAEEAAASAARKALTPAQKAAANRETIKKAKAKKKAHGGIIHGGMTNRLKHMLGDK